MRELKLAAMALLIVVVVPIIVGYVWPVGTETVDTWTTEDDTDITPSIAVSDIPIVDSYSGPMNHYWLYDSVGFYSAYSPVGYTSSPSSIPKLTYTVSSEAVTTNPWVINFGAYTSYRTDFITMTHMSVKMTDGTIHSCSTAVYMPGSNSIYLMGMGYNGEALKASDVDTMSVQGASEYSPVLLTIREYSKVANSYVDMSKGFRLDDQHGLDWFNGMNNHIVDLWIKSASISEASTIAGGGTTIALEVVNGTIEVNGTPLGTTSAYPYIEVVFDHDEGSVEVRGIIGANSFTDSTWRTGNSVAVSSAISLMDRLTMTGDFHYEVKKTYSEIGTGKGISNATIVPYSYYPHNAWQVSFESTARFGDSVTIGSTSFPIVDGTITFTDLLGEERKEPIRNMAILSLIYYDGPNDAAMQHIYINGYELESLHPDSGYSVSLDGSWYVSVTVSDVSQGEQTSYIWNVGSFGLDKTNYCLVGLIASITMMVGAGLWGRASGTKLLIVMMFMGISAIAYLVLMQ